jgi:hypothetical protein
MPVRRVVTKSRKRVVGYFASAKNDALIPWESQIERDYFRLLEADPKVSSFRAQPERLHYVLEGRRRTYVPDVEVRTADRVYIDEVKTDADAEDAENRTLFEQFAGIYAGRGYAYRVVVESVIRRQPRLANAEKLLKYRRHRPPADLQWRLERVFAGGSGFPLGRAVIEAERHGDGLPGIAVLLLRGVLTLDIDRPLGVGTELQFSRRDADA